MVKVHCFSCGKETDFSEMPGRREECSQCRADIHVCKNCQFYDPKSYNECRETSAEVVREKDRSNYCDHFSPGSGTHQVDQKALLRAQAEALFKKK